MSRYKLVKLFGKYAIQRKRFIWKSYLNRKGDNFYHSMPDAKAWCLFDTQELAEQMFDDFISYEKPVHVKDLP